MSTTLLTRAIAAASAAALTTGLLSGGVSHAAVDPSGAGTPIAWGVTGTGPVALPPALLTAPVAEVEALDQSAIFLTAAGRVAMATPNPANEAPLELADQDVISIAQGGANFGAVTSSGTPFMWGTGGPAVDTGATDVTNLVQIDLGAAFGVGLKADGTVVAWGSNTYGQTSVPAGLSNVTKVVSGRDHTYALRADGTVVGWGRDQAGQATVPAALTVPGATKDVEARSAGGLALLTDGTVVSWGHDSDPGVGSNVPPDSLTGRTVTAIAAGTGSGNVAIDSDGGVTVWGSSGTTPDEVPAGLDGRTLSDVAIGSGFAYAIQRQVMTMTASTVSGTAKQGSTLTGTPATFSGGPEVTHQWLANGTPIEGATGTSLLLGSAEVGKAITFRTVATKDGESLNSDSAATAAVAPLAPAKVSSKTTISKAKVKGKKASFTVKVSRSGAKATGKVTIKVKRGSKTVFSKKVSLKSGVAKVSLKGLKAGKHKVTASYAGDSMTKGSTAKAMIFKVR